MCCAPRVRPSDPAGWRSAFTDCQRGDQGACLWVGVSHQASGDFAEARALYQRACDANLADACVALGLLHEGALGVNEDLRRALQLYQRGCDLGSADGCHDLGVAWYRGFGGERVPERSTPLYQRGCELGSVLSCVDYGKAVGEGRGVPKDPALARTLWRKACPAEGLACTLLAQNLAAGDPAQALAVAREGCRAGAGGACREAGVLLHTADPALAARYHRTACAWGEEDGCQSLGSLLANALVDGGDAGVDEGEAGEVLAASCGRGTAPSCYDLARVRHALRGLTPETVALFEDACRKGSALACQWRSGRRAGGPEAAARAAEFCQRGCRLGVSGACAAPADAGPAP